MSQHREGYQDALNLVVSLCLIYTLCIACVRIWIRRGSYGTDDLVIAIGIIITLCNSGANYAALANGLGTKWPNLKESESLSDLNGASFAGVVTFIAGLYISKCAMLTFLTRITKTPSQIRLYLICNAIVASLGVVSALIGTVGCPTASGYYWAFYDNHLSCPSQNARWQAITGLDLATELLLMALPCQLVWGLQMPFRKKAMILIAFYLRIPVLGFSAGRNYYTMRLRLPETDPGTGGALVVIWLEVELAYALAASTLSALKAFTESFNSGFGLGFTRGKSESGYGMTDVSDNSAKSKSGAAIDSSIDASRKDSIAQSTTKDALDIMVSPITPMPETIEEFQPLRLRPEIGINHIAHVSVEPMHADQGHWREGASRDGSQNSSEGDDMVIVRETAYEVQHDCAPMLPQQVHSARA
ncbi:hypothetical protein KC318_g12121 [Hortaea werneckii]|uniref:Rhodopsin domain-containing protein n=1 Tax=Hortaea werneckii TaxID=91943 RepID=A0A3M7AS63_HORWE|nr:hypothetical protein KC355_g11494 [Hortaea werneckii]KAI7656890.1 hypothetical protein KC318_g12121 [Hortaea werneckii]RMY00336.1 hypothetical protein D0867_11786 [Hortaea werneckii]RMY30311.1 hypothetical protein D0866_08088 [Hortaea werneckii]